MRIEVGAGGLEVALKSWQKISIENRAALRGRHFYVGPAEARRNKDRLAAKRKRRAKSQRLGRAMATRAAT